jgi:transposase-like protein
VSVVSVPGQGAAAAVPREPRDSARLGNAARPAEQVSAEEGRDGGELSVSEREELRRLRRKLAEVELEKKILRKAAQYFAKEMGR